MHVEETIMRIIFVIIGLTEVYRLPILVILRTLNIDLQAQHLLLLMRYFETHLFINILPADVLRRLQFQYCLRHVFDGAFGTT